MFSFNKKIENVGLVNITLIRVFYIEDLNRIDIAFKIKGVDGESLLNGEKVFVKTILPDIDETDKELFKACSDLFVKHFDTFIANLADNLTYEGLLG